MKRFFTLLFLIIVAAGTSSYTVHKFYVAVFKLEHVPQKKVVQITSRVFTDDLEAVCAKKYGKKLYLGTSREIKGADDYVSGYFIEKLQIKLDGQVKKIKFLGRETEDDITICYYTIPADAGIKSLTVKNTAFFEMFPEQQNMVHTEINSNKKSLLLTNDNQQGELEF